MEKEEEKVEISAKSPVSGGSVKLYQFLCVLRILCGLVPNYIHPDEYFQSPEILGMSSSLQN